MTNDRTNTIGCGEVREDLDAFLDGEPLGRRGQEIEAHLRGCAECRNETEQLRAIRDGMRRELGRELAPPALWGKISDRLDRVDAEAGHEAAIDRPESPFSSVYGRGRFAVAGAVAAMAAMLLIFAAPDLLTGGGHPVVREPVNDLLTYRLSGRAPDLVASDPSAMAHWAQGKVPFTLPDLKPQLAGYRIAGLRLCWLLDRRLVAVSYGGEDEPESGPMLYVMESRGLELPEGDPGLLSALRVSRHEVEGHAVLVWERDGLVYVLVLDSAPDETDLPQLLAGAHARIAVHL